LVVLSATNIISTKKYFDPSVDQKDGKVKNTPLQNILYLKKGAKVVLIYNIDVLDCLNNGAKGTVLDFIRKGDEVTHVIVQFHNKEAGKKVREQQSDTFSCLYEYGTPIPRLDFSYSISKKQYNEGQKARCIQFPLQLGFAMTIHKVQGATFVPPSSITTDTSKIFQGSQVYTVLSRL